MNIKLGAHQSISGGYSQALERIKNIGGNCLQIFSSSPRGWNFPKITEQQTIDFINLKNKFKINPVYFHASYLINLADEGRIGHLSKMALVIDLNIASKLKIKGVIIHLGSFKLNKPNKSVLPLLNGRTGVVSNQPKYQTLLKNIKEIFDKTPKESLFIIENAGNRKIGQTLEEIAQIVKDVKNPRARICLDTCHLFSNGYSFKNTKELDLFLDKLEKLDLLNKLELWHVNDSRDPYNSGCDRHENIGQGTIGLEEFTTLLNNKKANHYPFIIETPGFDNNGPDKKNLDILKSLITT